MTIYRVMLYFLAALLSAAVVFSSLDLLPYSPTAILTQTFSFVIISWAVNKLFARLVKTKTNPESSLITALILSLIMGPLDLPQDWAILVVAVIAAMASKYIFVRQASHIFNPAAFGALISAVALGQPANWWAGGQATLPILVIGGLLVLYKIRRFQLVITFLTVYGGLLFLDNLIQLGADQVILALINFISSPAILFFALVMLVEPLTAPQTPRHRIYFGVIVGAILFSFHRLASHVSFSLELSLLIGNTFTLMIEPTFRQLFILRKKENPTPEIMNFWFEPTRRFTFLVGQFLEYTLSHSHADTKSIRRYFTIASSPTESQILLTTKFSAQGSTFKKALAEMSVGDEIIASKVAGDFVLPIDINAKLTLIAGGIGITPFRSMIKYLLDTNQTRDIYLLYGVKMEGDFVFREIFSEANRKFGLKTSYIVGIIGTDQIKAEVPDLSERIFYISGPEPMVQSMEKTLASINIPRSRIKRDYFPGYE